ncbi:WD40 repeat domain-containing protein [Reichenbachiella versicolor]|uniref:WD40 repeat domain-containing protein n=1 Tax=Reichenbachiella versicolor TaxID=1821036 RepID=UPI000D6E3FEA|nr:hypothetical protein [Reichenbachiella versicolor]
MRRVIFLITSILVSTQGFSQHSEQDYEKLLKSELVQSMSQRSLLIPNYHKELKALVARQAYNFWIDNDVEKLVSHKNVYSSLYYANKYLDYDSISSKSFNQAFGHSESVNSIIFGQKKNVFYSAGSDGRVLKWNLENIQLLPEVVFSKDVIIKSIDLSHDDKLLLINTKEEGIYFIDLSNQKSKEIKSAIFSDNEIFQEVTFYPKDYRYLGVNKSGQIRIKGLNIDSTLLRDSKADINDIVISNNSKTVFLGSDSGKLEIIPKQELPLSKAIPELFSINAIAISHDQTLLAVGREKGDAILIDLNTNKILRTIAGHQSAVTDVDFSPNDQLLLTASRDRTVRIWDTKNPRKLPLIMDDHSDWVFTASFTPNGNQVVSGSKDKHIRIWELNHEVLANRLCYLLNRNMTDSEWKEFVGPTINYEKSCPISE